MAPVQVEHERSGSGVPQDRPVQSQGRAACWTASSEGAAKAREILRQVRVTLDGLPE